MDGTGAGNDRPVLHGYVSSELNDVRQDDVITDVAVVPEMHVRHQQTILPNRRLEGLSSSTVDRRVLADDGVIPDFHGRFFTGVLQVLRRPAEYASYTDSHVGTERDVALECRARRQYRPGADPAVLADN